MLVLEGLYLIFLTNFCTMSYSWKMTVKFSCECLINCFGMLNTHEPKLDLFYKLYSEFQYNALLDFLSHIKR